SGTSDGIIDFQKGFKINFATKELDFKNVKNLANLRIAGAAEIKGQTSGGTESAIFDLSLNARKVLFEDFFLGNLFSNVRYRDGKLAFNDVAGAINATQYVGALNLNLNNNT